MKRSLIVLAALAASSAAFAQSSVSLYGIADIYVGKVAKNKVAAGDGGVSASRFGFKGNEDLGGGLAANFNFEAGVNLGNGATDAKTFQRQANVGLSGGFGTIKLGRSGSAFDDIIGATNSGFDSKLSANGVWKNTGSSVVDAQVYYATPAIGGFAAAVSTQLTGNAPTGKTSALNATYTAGALYAGLGYEEIKGTSKTTLLQASYDLGAAKLLGSYAMVKQTAAAKTNSYQIGADIPMGAVTLSVGYASSKQDDGTKRENGFGVAAAYSLSKRTTAYAGLRAANSDANDLWAFGIKHTF